MPTNIAYCHEGPNTTGLIVSMLSTALSITTNAVRFHIHSDIPNGLKARLFTTFSSRFPKIALNFYHLDYTNLNDLNLDYTPIYYYRLLLPNLHKDLDELIYLDTDLMVERDVSRLINPKAKTFHVSGVRDPIESRKCRDLNSQPPYINSGVMYLNLHSLRKENFTKRCLDWLNNNCKRGLHHHDQDAINRFLNGQGICLLDSEWNDLLPHPQTFDRQMDRIIHIPGPFKPWNICCPIRYRERFSSYLRMFGYEDLLTPIPPSNQAQSIYTGNQYRIINELQSSIDWFNRASEYRDEKDFNLEISNPNVKKQIDVLVYEGRLRQAVNLYAGVFHSAGFPQDAHLPYQYPRILDA